MSFLSFLRFRLQLRRTPLGLRQLTREKLRLVVALSGIAFADVLMFMQLGFQRALYDSNTRIHRSLNADIVLINPQSENLISVVDMPRRRLYQAMNLPGVQAADYVYVAVATWKNPDTREDKPLLVFGINPDRDLFNLPEVIKNKAKLKLPYQTFFDRAAKGDYHQMIATIDQGGSVTTELNNSQIRVVDLFQVGASFAADGSLIMSERTFFESFSRRKPGGMSLGLLHVQPGYNPASVAAQLNTYLPQDAKALTLDEFVEFEKNYWRKNTAVGFVFSLGTVMGFIVGIVIVYQVLATDVNDHLPEYATLKAMGYYDRYFLGVIFEEAVLLACIGFLPGLGIANGMYALTRSATNLPILMTQARALQVLILTLVMCIISGVIATQRLRSADPADIF